MTDKNAILATAAQAYGAAVEQLQIANRLLRLAIGEEPRSVPSCCDDPNLSDAVSTPAGKIRVCAHCGATVPDEG